MPPRPAPSTQRAMPAKDAAQVSEPDLEAAWLARLDASIITKSTREQRAHAQAKAHEPKLIAPPHPASLDEASLLRSCTISRGRSRGPGGQNRNKVETLVDVLHEPTSIASHAGERRTVVENRRVAITRLRLALAILVRAGVPTGECRSPQWISRCPQAGKAAGKIIVSPAHEDYPAMLALALDLLWACDLDPRLASTRLCCTPSQLVKLLKDHPHALPWLNAHRVARGLHALK